MARRGWALVAPLVAFLLVFFVVPIAWLLSLAVREAEVPRALPRTLQALAGWHADEPLPVPPVRRLRRGHRRGTRREHAGRCGAAAELRSERRPQHLDARGA